MAFASCRRGMMGIAAAGILAAGCATNAQLKKLTDENQLLAADCASLQRRNEALEKENARLSGDDQVRDAYIKKLQEEEALFKELQRKVEEMLKGTEAEGGVRAIPGGFELAEDLLFEPGRADIRKAGAEILKKMAERFKEGGVYLRVVGHTDSDPIKIHKRENPTEMNLELGARRAVAVAHELKKAGIDESRIHVVSFGESWQKVPNDSKENKKQNRRVEIYYSKSPPQGAEPAPVGSGAPQHKAAPKKGPGKPRPTK